MSYARKGGKLCYTCHKFKPLNQYPPGRYGHGGHDRDCKECWEKNRDTVNKGVSKMKEEFTHKRQKEIQDSISKNNRKGKMKKVASYAIAIPILIIVFFIVGFGIWLEYTPSGREFSVSIDATSTVEARKTEVAATATSVSMKATQVSIKTTQTAIEASWTPTPTVTPMPTSTPVPVAIVQRSSNIRNGPSIDYRKIQSASTGDKFDIIGKHGEWYKIKLDVGSGWIWGDLVNVSNEYQVQYVSAPPTPIPTATSIPTYTPVPTEVPTLAPTQVPTAVPTIAPTPVPAPAVDAQYYKNKCGVGKRGWVTIALARQCGFSMPVCKSSNPALYAAMHDKNKNGCVGE